MRKLSGWIVLLLMLLLASDGSGETGSYTETLDAWKDVPLAAADLSVPLETFAASDVGLTEETIGGEKALCWQTGLGSVSFRVTAPETALYHLAVRYAQLDGNSGQIERGVMINGTLPYAESGAFLFPKQFEDSPYPFARNEYGNEVRPRQNGVLEPQTIVLTERRGLSEEPLLFLLEQDSMPLNI